MPAAFLSVTDRALRSLFLAVLVIVMFLCGVVNTLAGMLDVMTETGHGVAASQTEGCNHEQQ